MKAALAVAACSVLAAACTPAQPADIGRSTGSSEGAGSSVAPVPSDAATEAPTTSVVVTAPATTEPPPALELPEPPTTVTVRRTTSTTAYVEPPSPQSRTTGRGSEPPAGDMPPDYIKQCESGGNYSAVNASSGAGGAWQFLPSTWLAVGGTGLPQNATPAEQDYRASILWANGRGASQWACA